MMVKQVAFGVVYTSEYKHIIVSHVPRICCNDKQGLE